MRRRNWTKSLTKFCERKYEPRCESEMREKRHKGHRRSFYECPNCHYNLTKMR